MKFLIIFALIVASSSGSKHRSKNQNCDDVEASDLPFAATCEELRFYKVNGYVIIRNFVKNSENDAYMKDVHKYVDDNFDAKLPDYYNVPYGHHLVSSFNRSTLIHNPKAFTGPNWSLAPELVRNDAVSFVGAMNHKEFASGMKIATAKKANEIVKAFEGYTKPIPFAMVTVAVNGDYASFSYYSISQLVPAPSSILYFAHKDWNSVNGGIGVLPGSHFLEPDQGVFEINDKGRNADTTWLLYRDGKRYKPDYEDGSRDCEFKLLDLKKNDGVFFHPKTIFHFLSGAERVQTPLVATALVYLDQANMPNFNVKFVSKSV